MPKRTRRFVWRLTLLAAGALIGYELWFFAHVLYWTRYDPETTAFMAHRLAELRSRRSDAKLRRQWVPYEKVSRHLKRALIASEDAKFLEHQGFDWDGIRIAMEKNLRERRVVAGGSTITQQLAKNLFLSGERSALRKLQEAVITVMLEAVMSKRRILEIYMNVVEWGEGVFGAEEAARHYFGTAARTLSQRQAARLASMLPNPRYYDRRRDSPHLRRKTQIILGRMHLSHVP
jgi:monofunctional biosynthetic peptidoglycan transglycosylase